MRDNLNKNSIIKINVVNVAKIKNNIMRTLINVFLLTLAITWTMMSCRKKVEGGKVRIHNDLIYEKD